MKLVLSPAICTAILPTVTFKDAKSPMALGSSLRSSLKLTALLTGGVVVEVGGGLGVVEGGAALVVVGVGGVLAGVVVVGLAGRPHADATSVMATNATVMIANFPFIACSS